MDLNNYMNEQKYQPDDIIYEIGSEGEVFYVLKQGKLAVETIIEIEDYHKYPIVTITVYINSL